MAATAEETTVILNQRAREKGDSFRIRVQRVRSMSTGNMPENIVTMDECTVEHYAAPETWLPKLVGGGIYLLTIYHSTEPTTPIGAIAKIHVAGEPRQVDVSLVKASSWNGPKVISWAPDVEKAQPVLFSIPGAGGGQGIAPQTTVPMPSASSPVYDQALESAKRELEAQKAQFTEARHRMELEAIQRDNDAKFKALRDDIAHAKPPAENPMHVITGLVGTLMPMVMQFMTHSEETRREALRVGQEAAKQQMDMLTRLLDKKAEDTPQTKIFSQMAESFGALMEIQRETAKQMMDTINPQEPTSMLMVKEIGKAIAAVAGGMAAAKAMPQLPAATKPKAAKQPAVVPVVPQPTQSQHMNEAPAQAITGKNVVDTLESMIRNQEDPNAVVQTLVDALNLKDEELVETLNESPNGIVGVFQTRLGTWVTEDPAHMTYMQKLFAVMQATFNSQEETDEESEDEAELD